MHKLRVFRVSPVGRTIKFTHSATTNSVTTSSALVQNTKVNWASCTDFIAAATTGFFGPKHTHTGDTANCGGEGGDERALKPGSQAAAEIFPATAPQKAGCEVCF